MFQHLSLRRLFFASREFTAKGQDLEYDKKEGIDG
jgi:hypothetical protein